MEVWLAVRYPYLYKRVSTLRRKVLHFLILDVVTVKLAHLQYIIRNISETYGSFFANENEKAESFSNLASVNIMI